MSLFTSPQQHAENPPEEWKVRKLAERAWTIDVPAGPTGWQYKTRREAQEAIVTGFLPDLYEKERRWYAGEKVAMWRPYAEIVAKNDRLKRKHA